MNFVKEKSKDFYLLDSKIENIFINEYMPAARGDYVKVFIYGCMYAEHGLPMDNLTMAKQLGLSEKDVQDAWSYWEKMGAIKRRYDELHEDMGYYVEFINLKELLYGKSMTAAKHEPDPIDFSNTLGNTSVKEMCAETLEKYGIRLYNIYDDLENLVVRGGKRANPLCKEFYGFDYSLSSDDEER